MLKLIALALVLVSSTFSPLCVAIPLDTNSPSLSTNNHALAKRTVAEVKEDTSMIVKSINALNEAVKNLPPSDVTLDQALAIHSSSAQFSSDLNTATKHVKATGSLSEADSHEILAKFEDSESIINTAMTTLIAKKHTFDVLPLGYPVAASVVRSDLSLIDQSMEVLAQSFVNAFPNSFSNRTLALKGRLRGVIQVTIAAYT